MSYVRSVADGQKYHLKVVLSDHSTRPGDLHVTIIFRLRSAEWRMVLCSRFGFLGPYLNGDVEIVCEYGMRRLVNIGYLIQQGGTPQSLFASVDRSHPSR